jgi:hypothetical protein
LQKIKDMEFKVKLKKLNRYGSDYERVKTNVVLEQQLSDLVEYFLSLSFEAREEITKYNLKNK